MAGAIIPPLQRSMVGQNRRRETDQENTSDDSEDERRRHDPSSRMRSATTFSNAKNSKSIRGPTKGKGDGSDSDFEFDL
jgi:hypothetical protein